MKKITKKSRLFLYGAAGFGVNMLNLIIGTYLCDALMTQGFGANIEHWTYLNKTLVVAGVWSVMITVAKILDGFIDIPFAAFTDNLKTRWGRRRPAIVMGFIPMLLAYLLFLVPLTSDAESILNTIWFGLLLCIFYAFYTLTMVTYYATFSEITVSDEDRVSLSNYKTVFDVIYFILGYALIPAMIGGMNIRLIALIFAPLSLTMVIPLFMIKEKSTLPQSAESDDKNTEVADNGKESSSDEEQKLEYVGLVKSLKYSLKNKAFVLWMLVFAALQFSLQLFLAGQNVLYSGAMMLDGSRIAIVMACAFAPVPLTLILYNKIVRARGIRYGYIFSLLAYMLSMTMMIFCRADIITDVNTRMVVACIGAVISSFGTGCFFSINYTVPSALAAMEERQNGISHPAMYFAVQGLASGIATAISTGLVWVNLKKIGDGAYTWIMPIIVIAGCLISLLLSMVLPKEINEIGKTNKITTEEKL